jgi:hypothetical protein
MAPRRRVVSSLIIAAVASACDWTEFDALEEGAPVVALDRSAEVRGDFGQWLASGTQGSRVRLIVGGQPGSSGAAAYELGLEQSPSVDANQEGFCRLGARIEQCELANSGAYLRLGTRSEAAQMCFAYAWGKTEERPQGVLVRCRDGFDDSLGVPRVARDQRQEDLDDNDEHQPHFMASDRSESPVLLVGLPNQRMAWFYPAGTREPEMLELPEGEAAPSSFGAQVAVMSLDQDEPARLFAVASPESGGVWLFRSDDGASAVSVGCLGGHEGFGRALAAGDVDGDGVDDLIVSEADVVTAFSGAVLGTFPESKVPHGCSLQALPEHSLLASFGCGSAEAAKDCPKSAFGASVAVGDLDGDGDGEILVGAPRMTIHGVENAGAVLVYDAEGQDRHELSDLYYLATPRDGDRLGSSIAAVRQRQRDIVAAGAPGNDAAYVFYCSDLLRDKTGRCAE